MSCGVAFEPTRNGTGRFGHEGKRSKSQVGPTTSAALRRTRSARPRSADTSTTGSLLSAARATRVSSPCPGAWTTSTPSAIPSSTPFLACPSKTSTTGRGRAPSTTARLTRVTSSRAAPGLSRHHPVGREPTTFAPSMRSTIRASRHARPAYRPGDQGRGSRRGVGVPYGDGSRPLRVLGSAASAFSASASRRCWPRS